MDDSHGGGSAATTVPDAAAAEGSVTAEADEDAGADAEAAQSPLREGPTSSMPAGAQDASSAAAAAAAAADVTCDMLTELSAADRERASTAVAAPGKENKSQNSSQGTTQTPPHNGSAAKRTRRSQPLATRLHQDQAGDSAGKDKDASKPSMAPQAAKSAHVEGPHSAADVPATAEQVADRSPHIATAPAQGSLSTPPGKKNQRKGVVAKAPAHHNDYSHHTRELRLGPCPNQARI